MKEENRDDRLHLPSLSISGFRGIDSLTIERLGRVTLLAGKNSVGKTTVLDAVRFYAARGDRAVLSEILESNEEVALRIDQSGRETVGPCWEAIFFGRDASDRAFLSIGPNRDPNRLEIAADPPDQKSPPWVNQFPEFMEPTLRILKYQIHGVELTETGLFCPYALSTRITRSRRVYQSSGRLRRLLRQNWVRMCIVYSNLLYSFAVFPAGRSPGSRKKGSDECDSLSGGLSGAAVPGPLSKPST